MAENPGNLTWEQEPPAGNGTMVAALSGPHNAAGAATAALEFLVEQTGAVRFAHADHDDFYVYGPSLPSVRVEAATGMVEVRWPGLEFRGAPPGSPPAPVFMSGARPQLRLLEFTRMVGEVARRCGVRTVLNLTSAPGRRAHTRPVVMAASVIAVENNPALQQAAERIRYDPRAEALGDPALIHACLTNGLNYAAITGFAPEYLNIHPNRQVSLELVRSFMSFARMDLDDERGDREVPPGGEGEGRGRPGLRAAESDAARPLSALQPGRASGGNAPGMATGWPETAFSRFRREGGDGRTRKTAPWANGEIFRDWRRDPPGRAK